MNSRCDYDIENQLMMNSRKEKQKFSFPEIAVERLMCDNAEAEVYDALEPQMFKKSNSLNAKNSSL